MAKFDDVRIELDTLGLGRVTLGDRDITASIKGVDIRARAGEVTEVRLLVIPGDVSLWLAVADVQTDDVGSFWVRSLYSTGRATHWHTVLPDRRYTGMWECSCPSPLRYDQETKMVHRKLAEVSVDRPTSGHIAQCGRP
jgi:hypothetical protein